MMFYVIGGKPNAESVPVKGFRAWATGKSEHAWTSGLVVSPALCSHQGCGLSGLCSAAYSAGSSRAGSSLSHGMPGR